jgi:hypothetical protein
MDAPPARGLAFSTFVRAIGVGREMEQSCGIANARRSAALAPGEHPDIRVDKVLEIRRQLGEGTYDLEDRLDIVIERIIEDLT